MSAIDAALLSLQPVPEVREAADLLTRAVAAHQRGDTNDTASLILAADFENIGVWFRTIVGPYQPAIHGERPKTLNPPVLPVGQRKPPRMPTAETRKIVLARDDYHCRFCDSPVVPKEVILAMSKVYPAEARWSGVASEQHRFFQAMTLQYDHVLPHSRGGDSGADNIVITCAACNYGRISWTVEEAGLFDPRECPVVVSPWRGLTEFLS